MDVILAIITLIFGLGLLVFIHELGHFLMAKLTGTKVEQFSIGFPPKIVGFKYGDTEYTIGATPIGGFVKIAGMVHEADGSDSDVKSENDFSSKNTVQKSIILLGGVLFNIITAVLIFAYFNYRDGDVDFKTTFIQTIPHHSVLKEYIPEENIRLVSINDDQLHTAKDVSDAFTEHLFTELTISYLTESNQLKTVVVPDNIPFKDLHIFGLDGYFESRIVVDSVLSETEAHRMGLLKKDTIFSINGYEVKSYNGLKGILNKYAMDSATVIVNRGSEKVELHAFLRPDKENDVKLGFGAGIKIDRDYIKSITIRKPYTLFESLHLGLNRSVQLFTLQIQSLFQIMKGNIPIRESLGGPVAIANEFIKTVGNLDAFLIKIAFFSMALAFFNLLPLPVFDGGSLLIVLVEGIRGKELEVETKLKIQRVGFMFILLLMIFVFTNDISRLF
jgi:regulator of sigma E protease